MYGFQLLCSCIAHLSVPVIPAETDLEGEPAPSVVLPSSSAEPDPQEQNKKEKKEKVTRDAYRRFFQGDCPKTLLGQVDLKILRLWCEEEKIQFKDSEDTRLKADLVKAMINWVSCWNWNFVLF